MPIDFNDNLQIRAPKPTDDRYGPWETIEEGLINVPYPYRYDKLTLNIAGVEYWFKDGLEDVNLIIKQYGSTDVSRWEDDIINTNTIKYGRLYNWYAMTDPRGFAPSGWHVPTLTEWQTLIDTVGGFEAAHENLRSMNLWLPQAGSLQGTDLYGFDARPAGTWEAVGNVTIFNSIDSYDADRNGSFTLSNPPYSSNPWSCSLNSSGVNKVAAYQSVRLIKDDSNDTGDIIIDGDTYRTITIGSQVWLRDNLAIRHYQNGDPISTTYSNLGIGQVSTYNNDENHVYYVTSESDPIYIRPKSNKRIKASIVDNLPPYVSIEEIQILLDGKEDKNTVITSYYVSTLDELILAWSEARVSSLPTNIYASGTITLTSNIYLQEHNVHGRRIAIIGVPNVVFNLNGYTLTSAGAYYENISFSNPHLSGYIFNYNGYINCKNCSFVTDGLDTNYNLRLPIPHITITDLGSGGSTGSIVIDGIQHNTDNYEWNRDNLIQPILINIATIGFSKLYISLKNVAPLSSFDRFSRFQVITSNNNSIFVTGDTTWFYAPEQLMPGQGNINSDSIILRKSSFANVKLEGLLSGTSVKILGIDVNNNLILNDVLTSNQLQIINTVPLVCSDEKTDIVASLTESKIKFVFQTQQSFTNIVGELNVAAVGGTFIVDVTKNGTSVLSTYLTFDSGETTTRTASIPKVLITSPISFNTGDYVEIFVRTVGALVPGKGLKIYLM